MVQRLSPLLLVTTLAVAELNDVLAQDISVGVVGGVNVASQSLDDGTGSDIDPKLGVLAGGHLSVDITPTIGFMLETLYSQKRHAVSSGGPRYRILMTYVEFPVLANFVMPVNEAGTTSVNLGGGPAVGFEIGCDITEEYEDGLSYSYGCADLAPDRHRPDVGLTFFGGLGVGVGSSTLLLYVGYTFGLTAVDIRFEGSGAKNRSLFFKAGYEFPLGSHR